MAWTDLERVKEYLGLKPDDKTDDTIIGQAIDAAQVMATRSRASSGYLDDDPAVAPDEGAAEGVTRWAALLYQSRGTGEGFAGFVDTGANIGTPYYETRRTILMLLGVPRPSIDAPTEAPV